MAVASAKIIGIITIVLFGTLLAGCVSGGQGAATAAPTQAAQISEIPTISEGELDLPNLDENTGLENETLGG